MPLWPFGKKRAAVAEIEPDRAPPTPDRLTYVVGDVHGCVPQLNGLLAQIEADQGSREADIVFVGDYTDRGPDSPGALVRLMDLDQRLPHVTCLLGNHDQMLLDFLDGTPKCMRWLDIGGFDTLINYNVSHLRGDGPEGRRLAQATGLAKAMGPDLIAWLRSRPLWWVSGDVAVVHALTDPEQPMEAQDPNTLLWQRPDETLRPRDDGRWVVHGHTIVRQPKVRLGHIAIDTGAYRGKPLTAAVLGDGEVRFLSEPSPDP